MTERLLHFLAIVLFLLLVWQGIVWATGIPPFLLPPPATVAQTLWASRAQLGSHALVTLAEIIGGLALGILFGTMSALILQASRLARFLLLPAILISQAIPVFALGPIFMLWFGYGIATKILITLIIIYFPITIAAYDGLRNTPAAWLDLARSMDASPWHTLIHIRLPAALPSFASGLRVAATIAPIGAIIGEWVGGSQGLGYLMTYGLGRMQTSLMFAALVVLAAITLALYYSIDWLLKKWIDWTV
ncbi:MAG: ABC transporter permease [Cardiobacteriaceae bacterium]|nr:ABC transporter permease [Cardiobacteriaceae bacterium]